MSKQIDALNLAEEALKNAGHDLVYGNLEKRKSEYVEVFTKALAAIREALAKPLDTHEQRTAEQFLEQAQNHFAKRQTESMNQELVAFTDQHIQYVMQYSGTCRDCADENGSCPNAGGLPCDGRSKAIAYVFRAIEYGVNNGFIPAPVQPVKQEPVAWIEDIDAMPFNTFCKAIVDWRSYSKDGDSYLEGENVEVIIVKYDMTEKSAWQEAAPKYVFLHEGKNQYLYTSVHVLKWKPLYAAPVDAKAIGLAIHYPDCWDTAVYPTLDSALAEIAAWGKPFRCTNDDCVDAKAIRAEERQRCIEAIRKAHDEELCDAYDCIKVIKELE